MIPDTPYRRPRRAAWASALPGRATLAALPLLLAAPPGPPPAAWSAPAVSGLEYELVFNAGTAAARSLEVVTRFQAAGAGPVELSLPAWTPGAYEISNFARHVSAWEATRGGTPLTWDKTDADTWRVQVPAAGPVEVRFSFLADSLDNAMAWARRDFLLVNGTNVFLYPEGQGFDFAATVSVRTEADWQVATGMQATGPRTYRAASYHELVDMPFFIGRLDVDSARVDGTWHRVASWPRGVFAGPARELFWSQLKAMQPTMSRVFAETPWTDYTTLLIFDSTFGGGSALEHGNSHVGIYNPAFIGTPILASITAHEIFHAWNVKRLRPAELARYDYEQENYTELLWFFEGFTSYYDDLFLRRAGLLDNSQYLKLVTRTINQVLQTPGRLVQSVAEASFDAWVKYYRQDENTANHTVSYYTKGSLVALCLDLALRANGTSSLDDVMRGLWRQSAGGPISEADVLAVVSEVGNPDIAGQLQTWVHSTGELPLRELLATHGIKSKAEPAQLAQKLGLRVQENHSVQIKTVLRGGAAEQAGMMAADEWLAVDVNGQRWRISKLDDVLLYAAGADQLTAWVTRDQQILQLTLNLDGLLAKAASEDADSASPISNLGLEISDKAAAERWLTGIAA